MGFGCAWDGEDGVEVGGVGGDWYDGGGVVGAAGGREES